MCFHIKGVAFVWDDLSGRSAFTGTIRQLVRVLLVSSFSATDFARITLRAIDKTRKLCLN